MKVIDNTRNGFTFKSKMIDLRNHYDISIRIYQEEQERGFLRCYYWKEDGYTQIIEMDTHFQFRGEGLGLLRFCELLDILEKNKLQPGKIVVEGVGAYSRTLESEIKTESFFMGLGFQREGNSDDWYVQRDKLKTKLEEKLSSKFNK